MVRLRDVMCRRIPLCITISVLVMVMVLCTTVEANVPTQHMKGDTVHPSDDSLLQSKTKVYSAAAARASLHSGERASKERFHSMAERVGMDVHMPRRAHQQNHQHEHEQQVMLDIVEKVLSQREHTQVHDARDGTHAEAVEDEFHLLNALMEKQSQIREFGHQSNEREAIGGVSRKFLNKITDSAIKNALRGIHQEHPSATLHSEPLHLYGVRAPYNGHSSETEQSFLEQQRSEHHSPLYSEEALADPYLSRNIDIDPIARTRELRERSAPQMVYRLGKTDNELLAQREVARNQEYHSHHRRSPQHEARRNSPTPRSSKQHRQKQNIPLNKQHVQAKPQQQQQPHANVPPPKTTVHEASATPAATASKDKVEAGSFLELDTKLEFDQLHQLYMEELARHEDASEGRPWFVHHDADHVSDSDVASGSLEDLFDRFTPSSSEAESDVDPVEMIEVSSDLSAEESQSPLRELGILMGLNPDKKPSPTAAAKSAVPKHAAAQASPKPQAAKKIKTPAAQPRFTQAAAGAKTRTGAKTGAQAQAQTHTQAHATMGAREEGEEGGGEEAGGGGGEDLEAMVNAGDAYKPSSLKHPPPPPVPPPPPPPPPPKFSAE